MTFVAVREKSSQSHGLAGTLRDDNRTMSEIVCRTGAIPSIERIEWHREKLYKNREVCLMTVREVA